MTDLHLPELRDKRGSVWRRWDPHIHTPGTVLNDQFLADGDVWDEYVSRIENAEPAVEALGITDYASLDRYEDVVARKKDGRLQRVALIFPNIELRFGIGTGTGSAVNLHLLVSPEDPDHVEQAREFLATLTFVAGDETYPCTRNGLIKLGRAHNPAVGDDDLSALAEGTNQFKVSPDGLRGSLQGSAWARENIIIGVPGGSGDGSSGLQGDAALSELRREIERLARVILSGQPKQRAFWLGERDRTTEELEETWGGRKACVHGSDAHEMDAVAAPDQDRYTWVKGDPTFEALRQACIEPATRVIVSDRPPSGPLREHSIRTFSTTAEWAEPKSIPLNAGLVAVIGGRGSGKTALVDLLAAGASVVEGENERSFLRRASAFLTGDSVELEWGDGRTATEKLPPQQSDLGGDPGVRYLSQQFVERLCSSEGGLTDELVGELERVAFEAHALESRGDASGFQDLLEALTAESAQKRARADELLAESARRIGREREKRAALSGLRTKREQAEARVVASRLARDEFVVPDSAGHTTRLEQVTSEIQRRERALATLERQRRDLRLLHGDVEEFRTHRQGRGLADLRESHRDVPIDDDEWGAFRLEFAGEVDALIESKGTEVASKIESLQGPSEPALEVSATDGTTLIDAEVDLSDHSLVFLAVLRLEKNRLEEQIGLSAVRRRQLRDLLTRISQDENLLEQLSKQIEDAEGTPERIEGLQADRKGYYASVIDAIVDREDALRSLYEPLASQLVGEEGALGRLAFSVQRNVDIDRWCAEGEELLDLRTAGPFRGRGSLREAAEVLLEPWASGSSETVTEAMTRFREDHDQHLLEHSPVSRSDQQAYRAWGAKMSGWLTSTDHISVRYGIEYDGVGIERLSPGTRGIVLLMLYLSLDQNDDRPLIIDQPEENLDPKSISDELVKRFRDTRNRRQVFIVTHNANLVVNADADQVIVASAGAHEADKLPQMEYLSGGIENPEIREQVCSILEGGARAFRERARRLRLKL